MESGIPCRHEFVTIYQRKLKGLERRLVGTRAYLPVGFKMADFSHLGEGSYCFCSKCRARLFPKRTNQDRAAAKLALAQSKQQALDLEAAQDDEVKLVNVEDFELESLELEDIKDGSVNLPPDDGPCMLTNEE